MPLAGGALGVQTHAEVLELNHAIVVSPTVLIQPELEYFIRPGAHGRGPKFLFDRIEDARRLLIADVANGSFGNEKDDQNLIYRRLALCHTPGGPTQAINNGRPRRELK
jgi:hypothetical protein